MNEDIKPSSITHYRIGEVAKLFRLSTMTIRKYIKNGQMISKVGKNRQHWFSKKYIKELLKQL